MSNFKVGDVCMYKPVGQDIPSNLGKIFMLVQYLGKVPGIKHRDSWETDTTFAYTDGSLRTVCPEFAMRKLDNPDDKAVDEMIKIVGKAPTIKEHELEI